MATPTTPPTADRQIWQLPTFLLGVAALAGVAFGRGLWTPEPEELFRRDLAALRSAVDKAPPDLETAGRMRDRVAAVMEQYPDLAAEAHFLIGSADLARAESIADDSEAEPFWAAAMEHLTAADDVGLPDIEGKRLRYQLAKAREQADAVPPSQVLEPLASFVAFSADPSEGHRRMAEAFLRLPSPNYEAAAHSIQEQLSRALPHTPASVLTDARLKLADIYVKTNRPADAIKVLERISPTQPAEFVASRLSIARGYRAEGNWEAAVRALEQARESAPDSMLAEVEYELGASYRQAGRTDEARAAWEKAGQTDGPAGRAANLRLAGLCLKDRDLAGAVALLEHFAAGPADNRLVPAAEVAQAFEDAIQHGRIDGDYDTAGRVAQMYLPFAENGRALELAAETSELWALTLEKQAATNPPNAASLRRRAAEQFNKAGQGYKKLAEIQTDALRRSDWRQKSEQVFAKAGGGSIEPVSPVDPGGPVLPKLDPPPPMVPVPALADNNTDTLEELYRRASDPALSADQLAAAWSRVGEAELAAEHRPKAIEAFEKAIAGGGAGAAKARYRLADLSVRSDDPSQLVRAVGLLEENLGPALREQDPRIHEQSMFKLGTALYLQRQYVKAEENLRQAVGMYPESDLAPQAWYQIAQSCYAQAGESVYESNRVAQAMGAAGEGQRAALQLEREGYLQRYQELMTKRIAGLQEVEQRYLPLLQEGGLEAGSLEADLLRRASMLIAETMWMLHRHAEALPKYEELADRYRGEVHELIALSMVWHISTYYADPPDAAKAAQVSDRMKARFEAMKAEEDRLLADARQRYDPQMQPKYFNGSEPEFTREKWENWFRDLERLQSTAGPE